MPMNTTPRRSKNKPATRNGPPPTAAFRMVNSLTNGPNGGEPVMARNPARNSAPDKGRRLMAPLHIVRELASVRSVNVAGRKEQDALGQAVVDQVQQRTEDGDPADADAQHQDAHVLDAGVGQHAFEVRCRAMKTAATAIDSRPMKIMISTGEFGVGPGAADLIDAQNRQEGATGDAAGQQRSHDARRLAIGVRLPRVHRRQAHLGSVADEQQHERGVQPWRRKLRRVLDELVEEQRRFQAGLQRCIGQEEGTEQRQGNARRNRSADISRLLPGSARYG